MARSGTPVGARRWLFGDQLGPHFLGPEADPGDDGAQEVLLVVSKAAFRRRRYHRAKAQLILSAIRHRAAELGPRARLVVAETYRDAVSRLDEPLSICDPTSWQARRLVRELGVEVLPSRGFMTSETDFGEWAATRGKRRLLQEDFYRWTRSRTGILMIGDEPEGGRWNFDADNRLPPPKGATTLGLPHPWAPVEDDIDAEVRDDMARWQRDDGIEFGGREGPRLFAATRAEALQALDDFVAHRLSDFGPSEDAALPGDWAMAHSLLSAPMNLGLLHPGEAIARVVEALQRDDAPLASVEGFVRQVMGWRDYVWHLYWHFGEDYVTHSNALDAHAPLPPWFDTLDADAVEARCLASSLADVRDRGWNHHILRLMVLGNWALQRGYQPTATTEWFTRNYVDAYPWVMAANVVGMALYADGGRMATKPYAAGGAYINRMTDSCKGCAYRPSDRVGERGCPFTAGYWWFLDRHAEALKGNHRLAQPLASLRKLGDRDALVEQEDARGDSPP
ncbi:MAG: cryptochrome/photolyase family protein [Actinomycetota bacterium]